MDDRIQREGGAMQHPAACTRGTGEEGVGSTSPASTQILERCQDLGLGLPLGDERSTEASPQGPEDHDRSRGTGVPYAPPMEEQVLRAWFNVVAGLGEVIGPDVRVVVRDPHAFMTCVLMIRLFAEQGISSSFVADWGGEVQQSGAVPAVAAMSEAGRVVSLVCSLRTGHGALFHPRGRVEIDNPNDLSVQMANRIVGPTLRLAREGRGGLLARGGVPIDEEDPVEELWRQDWPLEGDDQEALAFLRTQHMIASDDEEEDVEALAFVASHESFTAIRMASANQVTVLRDDEGTFQGLEANSRSRHQVNYSTLNQDDHLGRWAAVEPFSAAGARAALDAILLPSIWSQRGPVRLEIAPMRSNSPEMVTMRGELMIDPWSPEGIRTAFRSIQAVARARYPRIASGVSPRGMGLSPPAVTIIVTIGRGGVGWNGWRR